MGRTCREFEYNENRKGTYSLYGSDITTTLSFAECKTWLLEYHSFLGHNAGDTIFKLQVTINYGYDGIIPNMQLQDEIAKYYADAMEHKRSGVL
ncbi:MAG: hypothetical protein QM802_20245 [Agriterribacter sp.]